MSEWWTYSLSDFLMFSPRTYRRLFELFNAEMWPLHVLVLALGGAVAWATWRARRPRVAALLLAVAWAWVAWAFFARHYAGIHWAGPAMAAAFAAQAAMLGVAAAAAPSPPRAAALALVVAGLLVQPLVGLLLGRPWTQVELFGLAPDPTVTVTLGVLSMGPRGRWSVMLWIVPLLWCAFSAATLWTMRDPDFAWMPLVAAWAITTALRRPARPAPPAAP